MSVKTEGGEPAAGTVQEFKLVVTPSRRLFHVLNFPQNDFHVDGLEPPLTLKRVPLSQRRKARFEEADESISPLGGGRLTGRAFQSKTKNVYSDKRTPEQIAEMERDRQPLILRDANDTTFEGTVVSNSVAHYVALSHDGKEFVAFPIQKTYNVIGQRRGAPMTMEEIEVVHKRNLQSTGESMSGGGGGGGIKSEFDADEEVKGERMERRRRDAAAREENVGEGDWDYEEQDGDIIEDAGEDTVTNLKSGYEPTAEEIERAQSAKYSKDKNIKELLKEEREMQRNDSSESSDSEDSSASEELVFSSDSDDSEEDGSEAEESPVKAPSRSRAGSPAITPAAGRKRGADSDTPVAGAKRIKVEEGAASPAEGNPELLLTRAEVRRMWRAPITFKEFSRNFRARCKQHPQNNSLLHTFVREMFVAKENNGELLLYLASG